MLDKLLAWFSELIADDLRPEDPSARSKGPGGPALAEKIPQFRSKVVLFVIFLAFIGVTGRAVWLQGGFSTGFLQRQGNARFVRSIELQANRGRILDRNGTVLATSIPASGIWCIPKAVQNARRPLKEDKIAALARLLELPVAEVRGKLLGDRSFVYLKHQVDPEVTKAIQRLRIHGLGFDTEFTRRYPAGRVFAHVTGFTTLDMRGQEGVELAKNAELSGTKGRRTVIQDARGRIVEELRSLEPVDGKDVTLSIDSRLQYLTFKALAAGVAAHKARAGGAIVVDVRTGEILALANVPTYDPYSRKKINMAEVRNRVITDVYEPGSTLKPFAVAGGLENHKVTPNSLFNCSGPLVVSGRPINDSHHMGTLSVTEIIAKSSNIGTAKIALKMDPYTLWNMYKAAGFGSAPQIGMPGAAAGIMHAAKNWKPINIATISYGHGISVSLLQLARGYTTFTRNGDVIPLTIFRREGEPEGQQVYSPKTASQMRDMLRRTVLPGGTAARVKVPGFTLAGKTGTAYKLRNGHYVKQYVASFIGYAPASAPRYIVAVMIDEPTEGGHFGGSVSGPVFAEIMEGVLRTNLVPPDDPDGTASAKFIKPQRPAAAAARKRP